jgi:hypothetical protein
MTWPIGRQVAGGIPKDLGDALLNCWILGWNADHFLRALSGNIGALGQLWHGNIFFPERYTLGYSELLIAQSVQILPIYALTRNLVLCYNLLFLSTFALSGLGMFLLVRALVADWRAAFIAGLLFAFMPYRADQAAHLQVMSSQWMPFTLFGFHRAIASRRLLPLAGGALALVAQNLSCGYFLIFFSLFVPLFVLFEMWRHGRLGDVRMWVSLGVAAVLVAALTLPFMQPYLALRNIHGTRRDLDEINTFSADAWSYVTASGDFPLWGPILQVLPRAEGALFPGVLPILLALIGIAGGVRRTWRLSARDREVGPPSGAPPARTAWFRSRLVVGLGVGLTAVGLISATILVTGAGGVYALGGGVTLRVQSLSRALRLLLLGIAVLLIASARARRVARATARSPLAFAALCTAVAWYLSLGPDPQAARQSLNGPLLYQWLLNHVPGLDGLRVPARFAMIATLFLTIVSAWGARDLVRAWRTPAAVPMLVVGGLWLLEAAMLPFPVGGVIPSVVPGVRNPPTRVRTGSNVPPIYRVVRTLPQNAVLLEFPIGDFGWELQHMYYSTTHWRRIVNGYSGYTPRHYAELAAALRDPYRDPELAWQRLTASGVTHVVVHGAAYYSEHEPPSPIPWLTAHGASLVAEVGTDRLYALPR